MPEEAHRLMQALRTQRDEELLDLVREAIEKLNVLGDRLEQYVASTPPEETDNEYVSPS